MNNSTVIAIIKGRLVILEGNLVFNTNLHRVLMYSHFLFTKNGDGTFTINKNRETGIVGRLPDFNSVMNFIDDLQGSWITEDKPVTDFLQVRQLLL